MGAQEISVHVLNLEEKLKEVFLGYLKQKGEAAEDIWDAMLNRPYHKLEEWWRQAFVLLKRDIEEIEKGPGLHLSLVTFHSVFYHRRTNEYISCVDLGSMSDIQPTAVICLIDDIYDIYYRLQQANEMFDQIENLPRGHVINLFTIQDWREKEILTSRIIKKYVERHRKGENNKVNFFTIAVKHPFDLLHNLIQAKPTAYLSHPITEIRRLEESENADDMELGETLKKELNAFINTFLSSFALFLPTTIDEFRIEKVTGDKELYIPVLKPRWNSKYYGSSTHDSLFCCSNFDDNHDLWQSRTHWDSKTVEQCDNVLYDTLLRTLRSRIARQVSTRDYMLVEQSDYLVVFRPIFNGNLSGGVAEENNYYLSVREALKMFSEKYAARERVFMYCPKKDILKLIQRNFDKHCNFLYARGVLFSKNENFKLSSRTWELSSDQTETLYKYIMGSTAKGEDVSENICITVLQAFKDHHRNMFIDIKNARQVFPTRTSQLSDFSDSEQVPLDGSITNKPKRAVDVTFFRDFNDNIKELYNYKESCIFEVEEVNFAAFLDQIKQKIKLIDS